MTTYTHMIQVSEDVNLTNSQKLHELFKGAKSDPMSKWTEAEEVALPSSFPEDARVVAFDAHGQILIVKFNDDTYHVVDFGLYDEDNCASVQSFDEFDDSAMAEVWDSYLNTDDTPLAFYEGAFIDADLESSFLKSFPDEN